MTSVRHTVYRYDLPQRWFGVDLLTHVSGTEKEGMYDPDIISISVIQPIIVVVQ